MRMILKDDPDIRLFWMGLDNQEASSLPCVLLRGVHYRYRYDAKNISTTEAPNPRTSKWDRTDMQTANWRALDYSRPAERYHCTVRSSPLSYP